MSACSITPPDEGMYAWLHLAPGGTLVAWSVGCSLARAAVATASTSASAARTIARVAARALLKFPLPTAPAMVAMRRAIARRCGLIRSTMDRHLTRRELVRDGLAAGGAVAGLSWASGLRGALAAPVRPGRLGDVAYYHALADAFTICDHYHCSVIGPTDPNQLYLVSANLDPDGKHGGPLVETTTNRVGTYSWTTMPERLRAHGISWKAYASSDNYSPVGDTPFPLFEQFHSDPELAAGAFSNPFPPRFH